MEAYTNRLNCRDKTAHTVLFERALDEDNNYYYYVTQAVPITEKRKLYIVNVFIGEKGYNGPVERKKGKPRDPLMFDNSSATSATATTMTFDDNITQDTDESQERNSRVAGAEAAAYAEKVKNGNPLNRARL